MNDRHSVIGVLLIQSRVFRLKTPNIPFYEVEQEDSKKSELQVNG